MAKKRNRSSDSSSSSSSSDEEERVETRKKPGPKMPSSKIVVSSGSSSSSSDDDDGEWNAKPSKAKAKPKRGKVVKKTPTKTTKKKMKASSDSDESESDSDDDNNNNNTKIYGYNKKNRKEDEKEEGEVEDFSNDDDDDDDIEEFNDGFDENLMGDEEDQNKLAQMTEKEREQELFNRSEKREVLRTRFEIERKLRLAKKQELKKKSNDDSKKDKADKNADLSAFTDIQSSRSVERRRNMEDKRNLKDAIKGLKAEREKKKEKMKQKLRAADVYSDSSDSDSNSDAKPSKKRRPASSSSSSSSSSSISDDDSDADVKTKSDDRKRDNDREKRRISSDQDDEAEQFNFTLEHLNSIRLSRFKMEKWCHAPFFKDTVVGCFVRIGIGNSQIPCYIVGQITDIVETPKIYLLGKTRTNKGIKLKHAKSTERVYRLEYVSNTEFTQKEYDKWYTKMFADKCDFPSRDFLERKKTDITRALNYNYSDTDIELIVAEKERFKNKPVNFAMKKTQLMKEKEYAEMNGEHEKAQELVKEIDELEDEAKRLDKLRTQNIAAISFINERNRMRNIKEAERAIEESAKDAIVKDDPFTRRKCAPTMVMAISKTHKQPHENNSQQTPNESAVAINPAANSEDSLDSGNAKGGNSSQANNNGKPTNNNKSATTETTEDANDLFSAHNFDIKIDFDLDFALTTPNTTSMSNSGASFSSSFLSSFSNGKSANGFAESRPNPLVNSGTNRRLLNLDEYKKKKGLI